MLTSSISCGLWPCTDLMNKKIYNYNYKESCDLTLRRVRVTASAVESNKYYIF